MSLDGKLTKWNRSDVAEWSSSEDLAHFLKVRDENNLLVMGSGTFDAAKPAAEKGKLRVVMTRSTEKYAKLTRAGELEFTSEKPKGLVERLEKRGYKQILLVGGQGVATAFFEANLINEIWITIEPKIFGEGKGMVAKRMDVSLSLFEMKRLNKKGTVLMKYEVLV